MTLVVITNDHLPSVKYNYCKQLCHLILKILGVSFSYPHFTIKKTDTLTEFSEKETDPIYNSIKTNNILRSNQGRQISLL